RAEQLQVTRVVGPLVRIDRDEPDPLITRPTPPFNPTKLFDVVGLTEGRSEPGLAAFADDLADVGLDGRELDPGRGVGLSLLSNRRELLLDIEARLPRRAPQVKQPRCKLRRLEERLVEVGTVIEEVPGEWWLGVEIVLYVSYRVDVDRVV